MHETSFRALSRTGFTYSHASRAAVVVIKYYIYLLKDYEPYMYVTKLTVC